MVTSLNTNWNNCEKMKLLYNIFVVKRQMNVNKCLGIGWGDSNLAGIWSTRLSNLSPEEKKMFLQLVSVSGVGAKMGIAVLSAMNVGDIAVAIASSDVRRLTSVKGLGKKTAERIILELREKVSAAQLPAEQGGKSAAAPQRVSDKEEDAVVGLMSLGYTRAESVRAVRGAIEGGADSMEEIIMTALRSM